MVTGQANSLNASVLVLNKHYMAVHVTSVRRAFGMVYGEIAEIVSCEDDRYQSYDFDSWREVSEFRARYERHRHEWVRCVRFEIAVPRIIRLLVYDKLPQAGVKLNRRNLFARDHNCCQYCGRRVATSDLSLDHVVPRSQGGRTTWGNVVCACTRCNVKKGGRTPAQARMSLIAKPLRPRRSPILTIKLSDSRYASWKQFLDYAYWNVELK